MRLKCMAIVPVVALSVAACGADGPSEVSGTRDDVRKVAAVKEISHKEKKTERVCTRRVNGSCKSYRTDTVWKKVIDRHARPARYCVELDNVNGDAGKDDVWYTVHQHDYTKALFKAEDAGLKFTPVRNGC
ncbi:hypothetical protein SEA_WENTWORTH_81 [Streptomyces phage Wentworth]|nr:hypothetical protein SEA_WENTWORTH_81 [Streptomyces phage Wentworth]